MTAEADIRTRTKELQNTIQNATDHHILLECLNKLTAFACQYQIRNPHFQQQSIQQQCIPEDKHMQSVTETACIIFRKNHYRSTATFLLDTLSLEQMKSLTPKEFENFYHQYFLDGCCDDAFLTLVGAISEASPSYKLNKCVVVLEAFLKQHRLAAILAEQCGLHIHPDVSLVSWAADGRTLIWDSLVTEMAALPDKMANKLKNQNSETFLPQNYIALLAGNLLMTLKVVHQYIRLSRDCSLKFVSRLVGKLCLSGYADLLWRPLLDDITLVIRDDYIWARVCERIVTGVPDRCLESVLVPVVKLLPWYGLMDRFLGNSVTQKQKIQHILCTKLIFHRQFKTALVLQNIIGYLSSSPARQHLYVKLLMEVVQVWGDKSSLNHSSYEHHAYITQALFVCTAFLGDTQREENRDEILRILMPGVQTHIGSSDQKVRRLGMIAAEVITAKVDPDGPKLNFECEVDEETESLRRLLIVPEDPGVPQSTCGPGVVSGDTDPTSDHKQEENDSKHTTRREHSKGADSDLDSDDDLEPYDMSQDVKVTKVKPPKYIRDCMEGLIGCDNPDTLETCLGAAEGLIRSNPDGLREISAEFAKVLLHLTESYSIDNFRAMRFNALVALAVCCPKQVAEYICEQFYDRNYSIRQRLDIIEVIGTAAQELSKPQEPKHKSSAKPAASTSTSQDKVGEGETTESWKDIVQKRIESKTRRFGHGRTKPEPVAVANQFAPVAGYFFYPLMKNFDRQENTFDLMGEDCFVLGRLMYTLGIVMYAACNTPAVRQMAIALLEFIWVLRFHFEASVRQGLLFAVSMVYLAVPPHMLLGDLQQEVLETKNWLEDVIDKDTDTQCKTLAVQALVLLENIIKQEFLTDAEKTGQKFR